MMTEVCRKTAERRAIAADWFVELYFSEITGARLDAFENWVSDPENYAAFAAIRDGWQNAGTLAETPEILKLRKQAAEPLNDNAPDLGSDRSSGEGAEQVSGASKIRAARWPFIGAAIAACLALFLIVVPLGDDSTVYATGIGERLIVTLDDGSVLELDAASRVAVNYSGSARSIQLESGRANFEVADDGERPFMVKAGDKVFVAEDTEFSVELVMGEVRAVLYDGTVAVLERGASRALEPPVSAAGMRESGSAIVKDQPVTVAKGHQYIAPATGDIAAGTVTALPPVQASAGWRSGRLEFAGERLPLAVARVNRYSRTKVVLEAPDAVQRRVSGTFKAGQSEAFADGVAELYDLNMTRRDGKIILSQ